MRSHLHEESGLPDIPEMSVDENAPLLERFDKQGGTLSRLRDTLFGFARVKEPSTPTAVIQFIKARYPNAKNELLQRIDVRGVKNTSGGPKDIIIIGPKGGKSGAKIVVHKGYDYDLSSPFVANDRDLLGPRAQDLIEVGKREERQLQRDLAAERQQVKEAEKVRAETEKRNQNLQRLENDLERTKARREQLEEDEGSIVHNKSEIEG